MVYYGEYEVSLTAGGRVALPKKIRDSLNNKEFVITKGSGKCLLGYDTKSWEKQANQLLNIPILERDNPENLKKRRILFSSTVYLEIDDQGRAVLPKNLREFAALSKKAVIAGIGDHFEIWDKNRWEEYLNKVKS
ncbi:division/cell wall cluster transcriptional repressor MraZ [Candidatus Roizmanbacteria bacterium RIFCSPLOWO2_01_FULL_38_12]|uniref:Transcriptional regulator MraZ n=1 Tax=Candidatus Roizmanbacteria bacterium RIFCSPLOWO2_01_FULL_38_12 TaxID=1802061 RepID=A0A1F7ITH4_9BACT|nr:MAG: division/cell wall cluster transcriptional repressor MraZ [Candidatus Roizmanbacteria bacterium RIFCSPLOWO2_01_FULL_38_12]